VLVVGSGQSGCQVAEELLEAGRDVFLSVGSAGRLRRRYRGRDTMAWAFDVGFFHRPVSALPSPKARYAANPHMSGKRGGHTINLHRFAADGMTLLGRLDGIDGERATFADDLHANLRKGDTMAAEFSGMIDGHIARNGIDAPAMAPDNTDEYAGADGFDQPAHDSLDLRARGISTVIWAGGFAHDFSWVHAPVFDADGFPIADWGVTAAPGLAFLGLLWLHQFQSVTFAGVGDDATHVAETLVAMT
jgi:putative flavoprotein involved in K+ transport